MSALGSLFEMSIFFCFSPNKGHKRHGVQSCCDLPKHLGGNKLRGNKSGTRLMFILNN
jgi:hypothetical protein